MTVAELIVKLKVRAEGGEALTKTEQQLRKTSDAAKAAEQAVKQTGKAIADTKQLEFGFTGPAGQMAFVFNKDRLQGLPPMLEKVTDRTRTATFFGKEFTDNLKQLEKWAVASAVKMDALAASILLVVDGAMKGAQALERFTLSTGLPSTELQMAQGAGAKTGISPEEMSSFMTSLQDAGARIRLGGQDMGPWLLLSNFLHTKLDPRVDPLQLMLKFHDALMRAPKQMLPMIRAAATNAGVPGNVFAGLLNPEFNVEDWRQMIDIIHDNLGDMNALNAEWGKLKFGVKVATIALVSEFKPAIKIVLGVIEDMLLALQRFIVWLDKGSTGAQVMKVVLGLLAVAIPIVAVALTGFAGALTLLSGAAGAASLGPIVAAATSIGTGFGLAAAAVGVFLAQLALLKASLPRFTFLEELAEWMEKHGNFKGAAGTRILVGAVEGESSTMNPLANPIWHLGSRGMGNILHGVSDLFTRNVTTTNAHSNLTLNHTTNVTEAGNPQRTAQVTRDAITNMLLHTGYSMPAPYR